MTSFRFSYLVSRKNQRLAEFYVGDYNKPMTILVELDEQVKANPILLYMKGSPDAPQCGFSSKASQILIACGKPFSFVDILSNPQIRANLPEYSDWPTFPQLFVNGELVGGSDILSELHESGELQKIIDAVDIKD